MDNVLLGRGVKINIKLYRVDLPANSASTINSRYSHSQQARSVRPRTLHTHPCLSPFRCEPRAPPWHQSMLEKHRGRAPGGLAVPEAVIPGHEAALGAVTVADAVDHLLGTPDLLEVRTPADGQPAAQHTAPAPAPDLGRPYRRAVPAYAYRGELQFLAHALVVVGEGREFCEKRRKGEKKKGGPVGVEWLCARPFMSCGVWFLLV